MYVYLFPLFWYNIYRKEREVIIMTFTNVSKHFREERLNRAAYIATTVGSGEVVAEMSSKALVMRITDTGVILVVEPETDTLVTMYIATVEQYTYIANLVRVPKDLKKKVKYNESKNYTKEQYLA